MISRKKIELLENLRKDVDEIDRELTLLLDRRTEKSVSIGKLKKELGMDLFSPDREKFIFENILKQPLKHISSASLKKIFRIIINESLMIQKRGVNDK